MEFYLDTKDVKMTDCNLNKNRVFYGNNNNIHFNKYISFKVKSAYRIPVPIWKLFELCLLPIT